MDKVALITGAARGIGKQIAITLAKEGYNIALNYRTNTDSIIELKDKIESYGVKCLLIQGDVSIYEDTERMTKETIEEFGKIDVLVNNAGITKDTLLLRMKEEDFESVINVNLIGTYNMTKNVSSYMMKARNGRIINVSSVVGVSGNAGQSNYSASKAGIIGFTKSLAKELASRNILVNAVAPGFIETDMTKALKDDVKEKIEFIPVKDYKDIFDADYAIELGAEIHIAEDGIATVSPTIKVDGNNVIMTPFKI